MSKAPILELEVVEELMHEWGAEVGRRLRKRRRQMNLSLETVAALAGVSRQTVHRAEYDATTVRDETRHLIACALGTDVSDLWEPMTTDQLRRRAKAVA